MKNRTKHSQRCIHCHNQNVKGKKKTKEEVIKKYNRRKKMEKNQILHNRVTQVFTQCTGKSIKGLRNNKCLYSYIFHMHLPHITVHFQKL